MRIGPQFFRKMGYIAEKNTHTKYAVFSYKLNFAKELTFVEKKKHFVFKCSLENVVLENAQLCMEKMKFFRQQPLFL